MDSYQCSSEGTETINLKPEGTIGVEEFERLLDGFRVEEARHALFQDSCQGLIRDPLS